MTPTYYLLFALQCLFPMFEPASDYVGISIVNTDPAPHDFTVTATSSDGKRAQTGRVTLTADRQRAFLVPEIVGAGAPAAGWIRIESEANTCVAYMASGNDQVLAGTDADQSGGTLLWLPHISINTGFVELDHTDTRIAIVNAGTSAANVAAQLIGLDGVAKGTVSISVPGNGSRLDRISDLFREALPNNGVGGKTFEGYARLSSDVPVSAWQRIETPLSRNMLRAVAVASDTSNAVIPHFAFGGGVGYNSILNIVNTGPGASPLELRAFNDQGTRIGDTVTLTLRPGEGKRAPVAELFQIVTPAIFPPVLLSGYITIRQLPTLQPVATSLVGSLEILARNGPGKTASSLSPLSYSNATRWILPFAAGAAPYFSGYAIASVTSVAAQADVQAEVINPAGEVVDRKSFSLSPGTRATALIPSNVTSGYVRLTSNLPVYFTGTIGTTDLQMLDQLPAIAR
jgi:hypothetical protein